MNNGDFPDLSAIRFHPDHIWVFGLDPGQTTGLAAIAVPAESLISDGIPGILAHVTLDITGSLMRQVSIACIAAAKVCHSTKGYAPVIAIEDFDMGGNKLTGAASTADIAIPIRWGGAMEYAIECGHAEDAILKFQPRTLAFTTATDARLRAWDLYVPGDHKRDATRHSITMIRRIRAGSIDPEELWNIGLSSTRKQEPEPLQSMIKSPT